MSCGACTTRQPTPRSAREDNTSGYVSYPLFFSARMLRRLALSSPPRTRFSHRVQLSDAVLTPWQQIGWIVCTGLTLISIGVSFWLINKHLRNYTSVRIPKCQSAYPVLTTSFTHLEICAALYVFKPLNLKLSSSSIGYAPDIVRILFMVPLYAVISTASYFWWVSTAFPPDQRLDAES